MAKAKEKQPVLTRSTAGSAATQQSADANWLQQLEWRSDAAEDLRRACGAGDVVTSTYLLRRPWKLRKKQRAYVDCLRALAAASPAGAGELNGNGRACKALEAFPGAPGPAGRLTGNGKDVCTEEIVAGFVSLRLSGRSLNDGDLLSLSCRVLAAAETAASKPGPAGKGWQQLVLQAEIPILRATMFPGLKGSRRLFKSGLRHFRQWLASELDETGNIHACWLNDATRVVSSFARAALFARLAGQELWDKQDRRRLVQLAHSLLALGSPGRLAFAPPGEESPQTLLNGVLGLGVLEKKDPVIAQLSEWAQSDQAKPSKSGRRRKRRSWTLPEESWQSDHAGWASLRTDWNSPADVAQVRFDLPVPEIDLVVQDRPLLSGQWDLHWRIGGEDLPVTQGWTCECWFSDADVDYLELTQKFEGPSRMLVRQVILAKQESCLILADSIRCPGAGAIEYEAALPLEEGFGWEQDAMTRESALITGGLRARLFPLAQPQSKVTRSDGRLWAEDGRLKISHSGGADGLFVPLVVEWDPDRTRFPADWSQLTVAESGRKLAGGEAVGYRLRVGKRQWLLYHQLKASKLPRSVLGVHTLNETLFARFGADGDVDELLLVEAPQE